MTSLQQRQNTIRLIEQAHQSGARQHRACQQIDLCLRTLERWKKQSASQGDRRTNGLRCAPAQTHNQLSPQERSQVLSTLNNAEFESLPPSQIVPRLADRSIYLASESTMYRILRQENQLTHRRSEKPSSTLRQKPRSLCAQGCNEIYTWDITYLPTLVRGLFYYLYLYVDIFSRKIVGWQVFDTESAQQASELLQDICERNGIAPDQLTVHSDNGAPMKGQNMIAMMQSLGVAYSRSRPAVSNDNPYSEALFKTLKYRADLPVRPFENIQQAREWASALVRWYNEEHRHSGIAFVTPCQRDAGRDQIMLFARKQVYERAKAANPQRWSRQTRNWKYIHSVHLNPEKPIQREEQKQTVL
ncbi:MAG: IS3 family transposase [Limnobacter sp.]|nr:IS3 family transposase [Limnobacter sp.]